MSEQNTGGDGSVKWSLDAGNVRAHRSTHRENGSLRHEGVDTTGNVGDLFTVSIEVPEDFNGSAEKYLEALKSDDSLWGLKPDSGRVYFNLKIESMNHDQIRITWGDSPHMRRPKTP
jgi:hypothetical protein